jgi:hypothetical protein
MMSIKDKKFNFMQRIDVYYDEKVFLSIPIAFDANQL